MTEIDDRVVTLMQTSSGASFVGIAKGSRDFLFLAGIERTREDLAASVSVVPAFALIAGGYAARR